MDYHERYQGSAAIIHYVSSAMCKTLECRARGYFSRTRVCLKEIVSQHHMVITVRATS